MNAITLFSLQVNEVENLGATHALEFFRRLLWAESYRVGISKNLIDVPDCINVGDGGLDAVTSDAAHTKDDIIPSGTSGYQIKSSDLKPVNCKKELHVNENLNDVIKPEIKSLLDKDGTYVLVLFADITVQKKNVREQAIKEELANLGYTAAKVRINTANQLINFAEGFPALISWLKNNLQCLPYSSWTQNRDVRIPRQFIADEERQKLIDSIRKNLRNPGDECQVIRVMGLSGIGKTRFVFETLSPADLRNRVIYVKADQFLNSNIYQLLQNDQHLSAIIVVDECDLRQHDELVRSFSQRGQRLALITLSYDIGKVPLPTLLYILNPLRTDAIEEILKTKMLGLPTDVTHRLSEFADGYPRLAVLLGESYQKNKGSQEDFLTISDGDLINRLLGGDSDTHSGHFRRTEKVLMGLSLFKKIGYRGNLSKESKYVADLAGVEYSQFKQVVEEQRQRGIIQGQNYIYVTPFMLRIHLIKKWWSIHGLTKENFDDFVAGIPEEFRADMLQRFFDHIPYIEITEQGKEFAMNILGDDGIFADGSLLKTKVGADFFLRLTEADPKSALECLKRTVGTWDKEALLKLTTGRREVVWAIGKIVVWKDLFADAAKLLLALGEAENESYSNNASGTFADLFAIGLSSTEASPEERFPILLEALGSDSKERRMIALQACDKGLESQFFTRAVGAEYQGLRREPALWMPKTYGDLYDAYRQIWHLLKERLDDFSEEEQNKTVEIFLNRTRGLVRYAELADMIIDTLSELAQKPYVDKKEILVNVLRILHYDKGTLTSETPQRLEALKDELTGIDYSSLMKRYVGMDLLEDKFDEEGRQVDQTRSRIETLAQQSIENKDLLISELGWLVTAEAQNGFCFGYELGRRDKDFSLLLILLDGQRNAGKNPSVFFLGGYFRALFENDKDKWEIVLDEVAKDEKLSPLVPELTWRSGITDKAALRILELAENGIINVGNFRLFCYGGVIKQLSEETFKKWIEFLLASPDDHADSISLDLYNFYYVQKESTHTLPKELTIKLLTHQSLFKAFETDGRDQMDDFHWSGIGKLFVKLYPDKSIDIAYKMLEHFGEDGTIVASFHSEPQEVLNEIAKIYPEEIWERVSKYLGPPTDSRAVYIRQWLRGGEFYAAKNGALSLMPIESIWPWVDEDVENRAWYIASFVSKGLFRDEANICLAREVLVRYGDREDVRNNLRANFSSEGWSGPKSLHYENKKQELLEFKKDEDNENVKRWLDDFISILDKQIELAKIEEERRGF